MRWALTVFLLLWKKTVLCLQLARGAQVFSIKAGYQGWFQNHLAIPDWQCTSGDYFDAQVGACYAINGDTLDIKLSFVRTTLCETFNFRFAENGFFAKVDILPDHENPYAGRGCAVKKQIDKVAKRQKYTPVSIYLWKRECYAKGEETGIGALWRTEEFTWRKKSFA